MRSSKTRRLCSAAVLTFALTALLGPAAAGGPLSAAETAQFDAVLAPLGLSSADLTLPAEDIGLWGGDKYKLKVLDFLRSDVTNCGPYARSISGALLTNKANLGGLVTGAHSRLDNGIRLGLVDDPLAKYKTRIDGLGPDALAYALAELAVPPLDGSSNSEAVIAAAKNYLSDPAYQSLPDPLRRAAALVLFTVPEAQRDRQQGLMDALESLGPDSADAATRIVDFTINTFADEDDTTGHEVIDDRGDAMLVERLLDRVDWNYINRGSTLLAIASQEATRILLPPPPADPATPAAAPAPADAAAAPAPFDLGGLQADFLFEAQTPLGRVRLAGASNQMHSDADCLLSIDCGGNDSYLAAANASLARPVSIAIDLAGDDHFGGGEQGGPSQGSGIFGTGILIDVAGNDSYSCTYVGEGSGIFGTGVLYDMAGDDVYSSFGNSQGSGTYGAGILADLGGNDVYNTYKYGQAYGGARGCGVLLDAEGDDRYLANMTDHFNGGLYGPTHHVHFVQGSAYGRRADITDGHSWSGGFGLLVDGAGDDFYEADCYGQGNAYWHSVGMLVDKSGDDVYRAGQYSQASAPHFACGILQDDGGDDKYLISIRQSMAHGRDWSIAWLEDSAGDDWYQGARTTLGCSHVNSISVFWDKLGDDNYIMKGTGLGESEAEPNGSPRDWLLTLGLFIDGAGQDGYYLLPGDDTYEGSNSFSGELTADDLPGLTKLDFAGDSRTWQRTPPPDAAPGYMGSGMDL